MAKEITAGQAKLIQYLNEAYGKEKQLETALQAHITMTTRDPYTKRLKQHLKETKSHATQTKRRIKALGGTAEELDIPGPDAVVEAATTVQSAARKGLELLRGQAHVVRGTGEAEKMLKNAKTEYSNEAEEIANYRAIEQLAETIRDKETAKMARAIRREEERMGSYLERLIPQLVKAVAQDEIPASERGSGRRRSSRKPARSSSTKPKRSGSAKASSKKASSSQRTASSQRRGSTARSSNGRPTTRRSTRSRAKRS